LTDVVVGANHKAFRILVSLLVQFLLRLTFGLAAGMALCSPREVTSGYFRNHLYVTLGLSLLAGLVAWSINGPWAWAFAAAGASYFGAACWLYESSRLGRPMLCLVAALALVGALQSAGSGLIFGVATATSGLLLGLTMAAMLLGHWYLNTPTMQLAPLRRLLLAMAAAVVLQMVVSAWGVVALLTTSDQPPVGWWLLLVLRWLFGLVGVLGLTIMAWKTLEIPNTQSATGILYVAVIGVFAGELLGLLLSAEVGLAL
jgi:hypothetical protein